MVQKWEYKIRPTNPKYKADIAFEDILNEFGKEGWELVGVQEKALYFKRLLKEKTDGYVYGGWSRW